MQLTVLVFCTLYHGDIHLHRVTRKYLEQFSSYRVDINILQKALSSKDHNSKSRITRVTVLAFCTSSHNVLHFCYIKISGTICNLQSGHEYIAKMVITRVHSKIVIFNISCFLGRTKSRLTRVSCCFVVCVCVYVCALHVVSWCFNFV